MSITNILREKFEITHIKEFKDLIKASGSPFSEYCFSNLYLFRHQHDYTVLRLGESTFLEGTTYDGEKYIMPFNPLADTGLDVLSEIMSHGYSLFPVREEELGFFPDDKFTFSFNRDDSDYVYTSDKIKNYPGRHLHKKRNLVKQYRTLYNYSDREYVCTDTHDAMYVLDKWLENSELPVEETDYASCRESIENCVLFGLTGQIYYADSKPSGLLFGEELNEEMFVIHFAKGLTEFKGIYPHMYTSLANSLDSKYQLLNFEQDLGKESLRQAKSTYLQDFMLDKYRVRLIK